MSYEHEPLRWWWVTPFYVVYSTIFAGMGFRMVMTMGQFIGAPLALVGSLAFVALFCSALREAIL